MKNINAIAIACIVMIQIGCEKNAPSPAPTPVGPVLPTITTTSATEITRVSAKSGGTISNDGGATVITAGLCFSTGHNPTTANNTITNTSSFGSFNTSVTGLSLNTTYYARAFATNSTGTAYGNEITFTTKNLSIPTITTQVADISIPFATTSGGIISDDGGLPVTTRGVCWGTAPNPTISGNKTIDGSGMGTFSSAIAPLTVNTTYYIRAYATNNLGIAYGDERMIVLDIEGNVYNAVKIGSQVWMMENLKTTHYNDGSVIQNITSNSNWSFFGSPGPAMCWYNNDISNKQVYGALYNWFAVNTGSLSPTGWHIPTSAEFAELITFLDPNTTASNTTIFGIPYVMYSSTIAGGKLKESGTVHWNSPNTGGNESGFTGLGAGVRQSIGGAFEYFGGFGGWWSSSQIAPNQCYRAIISNSSSVVLFNAEDRQEGLSIRCIKN